MTMTMPSGRRETVPRWLVLGIAVAAVASIVSGWLVTSRTSTAEASAATTQQVADTAVAQRDATVGQAVDLATLVRQRCSAHVITDTDVCSAAAVVQAQPVPPPPAVAGPAGREGAAGTPGTVGPTGLPGITPPCYFEPTQCRGADGQQGPPGDTGPSGPAGAAGPAGASGPAGPAGQDGSDGVNGQDGAPGAPGPAGRDGCDAGLLRDPDTGECVP